MVCYCTREDNVKLAKVLLNKILSGQERSVKEVYAYCLGNGVTKSVVKEACKEMGIKSVNREGEQYWSLPVEREQL